MFTDRDTGRLNGSRVKQSWPEDKPFKILSLDGGGIRGIFSAAIIKEMAAQLPQGDEVADYFDLIAGTSTGGIIAIALGLGVTPNRIFDLYFDEGDKIFPPFWARNAILRGLRQFVRPIYNHQQLERLLRGEFQSKAFGDSKARLLVPAFAGPRAQITVFKTDHHRDYKGDWKTAAWNIARATSAAPTYFEGYRHNLTYFLDGGVWANNPVMLAIVEAISAYNLQLGQIQVVSIGTGNPVPTLSQRIARTGAFGWRKIILTAMYLTTDTALSQARHLLGFDKVVRLEPSGASAQVDMDDWSTARDLLPDEAVARLSDAIGAIAPFFSQKVAPRERYRGQ